MKIKQIIEAVNNKQPLIVVDIQPSYEKTIYFDMEEFCEYLNDYEGEINYFFNGPELGFEDTDALKNWLEYYGLNETSSYHINFIEKEYAWVRDAMDTGVDENDIIKLLQLMIKKDFYDFRYLAFSDIKKLKLDSNFTEDISMENISFSLPSVLEDLKEVPKSGTIIGGGEDECLLEMEITLQALKKKYKRNNKFIY